MKTSVLFGILSLAMGASAFARPMIEPVTVSRVEQKEVRDGVVLTRFTLNVFSGGCTSAEHFETVVTQKESVQVVTFVRKKPDYCEAYLPAGERVVLTSNEILPGKPIAVNHPLFVQRK